MGERWATELCHQDYLSERYFASESQDSDRWLYYLARTSGQNTILYNNTNQKVTAAPPTRFESTGSMDSGPEFISDDGSTALWITDMSSAYDGPHIQRGLRLLLGRSQVLIQDEIQEAEYASQWRMHTRADIDIRDGGKRAGIDP
jgi:Heparinase II/III-like protein